MDRKYINLESGKMAYYLKGEGKPLVFLHGWGQSFASFKNIIEKLAYENQVLGVDFLGFGSSTEPLHPLGLIDYVSHLRELFEFLNINSPIILAHSFGGRVAIKYASQYPVEKLILVSSAGIKNKSFRKYYNIYTYKFKKFIFKLFSKEKYFKLLKNSGSKDYKEASNIMKKTMSKIVNYDVQMDLKRIDANVYLLWGIQDLETRFKDAEIMSKRLKKSRIIPFYNSGHFCYIEEEEKFVRILNKILEESN